MRLNLKFELNEQFIDIEYRKMFISYFKYCLNDVDEKYFKQYYANTNEKTFTFAVYLQNLTRDNDIFRINSNIVSLNISFLDEKQGYLYYAAFLRQINKLFNIKNNQMKLISVNKINETKIINDCVIIKTLSPICLLNHSHELHDNRKDYYYSIIDNDFTKIFEEKTGLKIQPIDCKKVMVRHYNISIPTTIGTFIISGDSNKINKLYKSGIGNKTGQGFGMIDII